MGHNYLVTQLNAQGRVWGVGGWEGETTKHMYIVTLCVPVDRNRKLSEPCSLRTMQECRAEICRHVMGRVYMLSVACLSLSREPVNNP